MHQIIKNHFYDLFDGYLSNLEGLDNSLSFRSKIFQHIIMLEVFFIPTFREMLIEIFNKIFLYEKKNEWE
jgi:hypothetical protein